MNILFEVLGGASPTLHGQDAHATYMHLPPSMFSVWPVM